VPDAERRDTVARAAPESRSPKPALRGRFRLASALAACLRGMDCPWAYQIRQTIEDRQKDQHQHPESFAPSGAIRISENVVDDLKENDQIRDVEKKPDHESKEVPESHFFAAQRVSGFLDSRPLPPMRTRATPKTDAPAISREGPHLPESHARFGSQPSRQDRSLRLRTIGFCLIRMRRLLVHQPHLCGEVFASDTRGISPEQVRRPGRTGGAVLWCPLVQGGTMHI
jgi:hypothetical protein